MLGAVGFMLFRRPGIGVLEITGFIGGGRRTEEQLRLLRSLEENRRYRAAVLDIDSPGGSASASEYLHNSIARVASQKPVVAFIRGVGASGAYMASCAATKTVAFPSAIVGSIGVISLRPVVHELLQRLGIKVAVAKSGHLKDMGAPYRESTPEEQEKEQALVQAFYERFLDLVAQGRRMERERVKELATGEIFIGTRAKELGLVDELGDMETALDLAAQLGKVKRRISYLRPRRSFRERFLFGFSDHLVGRVEEAVEDFLARRVFY